LPVAKPVPVQVDALADDHERVDDWPAVMDAGLAEMVAVGAGAVTVTVAFALTDALPFEQVTE
jgi:hypothetical protein